MNGPLGSPARTRACASSNIGTTMALMRAVDLARARQRGLQDLLGRRLAAADQVGQAESVEARVLLDRKHAGPPWRRASVIEAETEGGSLSAMPEQDDSRAGEQKGGQKDQAQTRRGRDGRQWGHAVGGWR